MKKLLSILLVIGMLTFSSCTAKKTDSDITRSITPPSEGTVSEITSRENTISEITASESLIPTETAVSSADLSEAEQNKSTNPDENKKYEIQIIDSADYEFDISNEFINVCGSYSGESPTFETACKTSDITAVVQITKYYGIIDKFCTTVFTAKVLKCYKGNVKEGDEIYINQGGIYGKFINKHDPLFKISKVYLLNLKKCDYSITNSDKTFYERVDREFGVISICEYNDYKYCVCYPLDGYFIHSSLNPVIEKTREEVIKIYYGIDKLQDGVNYMCKVYTLNDIEKAINKFISQ